MKDQIFFNSTVLTLDDANTTAEAMSIRNGKVFFCGSFEEARNRSSADCKLTDLRGRAVMPGFNDSHTHLVEAGEALHEPDLRGLDEAEIFTRLSDRMRDTPRDVPIVCRGWDFDYVPDPRMETLDRFSPRRPVFLFHKSGHSAWFNRAAFNSFGLRYWMGRKDNLWKVHADQAGDPVGVIDEPHECPSVKKILEDRQKNRDHAVTALGDIIPAYLSAGITSVQDNTWYPELYSIFQEEVKDISMTCWPYGMDDRSLPGMISRMKTTGNFGIGPVKFFIDGAFGSRTAWLWEPYQNDGDNCGIGLDSAEIVRRVEPYAAARRQLAFHAIGDRAVSELCDALELLQLRYPWIPELRIRIEHAQMIREDDFPRLKRLGIVVSAQPPACEDFLHDLELIGEERAMRAYPHRTLLERGIPLALGSDFPFEFTFDPIRSMDIFFRRPSPQRMDPLDMIRAYTRGSAYAEFAESTKGSLEPGKDADFIVLSQNPLYMGVFPDELQVELTYRRGVEVFRKKAVPIAA